MAKSEVQEGGNEWDKDIDEHKLFMIENRVVGYIYIYIHGYVETSLVYALVPAQFMWAAGSVKFHRESLNFEHLLLSISRSGFTRTPLAKHFQIWSPNHMWMHAR